MRKFVVFDVEVSFCKIFVEFGCVIYVVSCVDFVVLNDGFELLIDIV